MVPVAARPFDGNREGTYGPARRLNLTAALETGQVPTRRTGDRARSEKSEGTGMSIFMSRPGSDENRLGPASPAPGNLVALLQQQARQRGGHVAYLILDGHGEPSQHLSYQALELQSRQVAARLQREIAPGSSVLLLVDTEAEFVTWFWGCLFAGVTAVPVPAPRHGRDQRSLERLRAACRQTGARAVIGGRQHRAILNIEDPDRELTWLDPAEPLGSDVWQAPDLTPEATAFIQLTSGSTAAPRGAVVSHGNVLANVEQIADVFGLNASTVSVGWLPLYHDMGLVGLGLSPVFLGGTSVLMPVSSFVRDPLQWLDVISRFRATVSGAPPFAYHECVRKQQLEQRTPDLSSWQTAFVGAEPVNPRVLKQFAETFESAGFHPGAFLPCYGLAENTLFAAGGYWNPCRVDAASIETLDIPYPLVTDAAHISIHDPETGEECAPGQAGEIVITGPCVAGVLIGPAAESPGQGRAGTTADFGTIERSGRVRTGDLGWLDQQGLHVSGRLKDLIIIRGRNYSSTDFERSVHRSHPALSGETTACIPIDSEAGEQFVVLQELEAELVARESDSLAAAIVGAIVADWEVSPACLCFVRRGMLPRTTSGKVARARCRQAWDEGNLRELARWESPAFRASARRTRPVRSHAATEERDSTSDIAIIGQACRFPGGASADEFWISLRDGRDPIAEVPPDRWDAAEYYSERPAVPGKMNTRWGGFIPGVDEFDPAFFGIAAHEAREMDPQQRLLLETTWKAIEDAGLTRDQLSDSLTGVFIGVSTSDYLHLQIKFRSGMEYLNAYSGLGNASSICANRISYTWNLRGPSVAVDTACSSSLMALHLAVESLRRGECQQAIVGGVNLLLSPGTSIALSQFGMMSPDGRCKVFDAAADGYVRSEGCGVVILKPVNTAVRDGDRVRACVCGSATNQDGHSAGMTAPNGRAQHDVIHTALERAGIHPESVSFLEAHGTGTAIGDPVEVEQLAATYGTQGDLPCWLGSVKASVGHLEAAAGIASVIKTVLALEHQTIPPQLHLQRLNPRITLEGTRLTIPVQPVPWAAQQRIAAISSFGFGGTNVHVVVREAAAGEQPVAPGGGHAAGIPLTTPALLTLSAATPTALQKLRQDWQSRDAFRPAATMSEICSSQTLRRTHFRYRAACVVRRAEDLQALLKSPDSPRWHMSEPAIPVATEQGVALLFPGLDAAYPGMAADLYQRFAVFRAEFDECARRYAALTGAAPDALAAILRTRPVPLSLLGPGLFAVEYACARMWQRWGLRLRAVLGHGLGEVAAAVVAGILSCDDGLRLMIRAAALLQSVRPARHRLRLGAGEQQAAAVAKEFGLTIRDVNSPESVVLTGSSASVAQALLKLEIPVERLTPIPDLSGDLVWQAEFDALARTLTVHTPEMLFISGSTGQVLEQPPDASYWARLLSSGVRFSEGLARLEATGVRNLIECGPGRDLTQSARQCPGGRRCRLLRSTDAPTNEGETALQSLAELYTAGVDLAWPRVITPVPWRGGLPGHSLERARYWYSESPTVDIAPGTVSADGNGAARVFEIQWGLSELKPGRGVAGVPADNWIILGDGHGLASRLADYGVKSGRRVYWVGRDAAAGPRSIQKLPMDKETRAARLAVPRECSPETCYELLNQILTYESREKDRQWQILYLHGLDGTPGHKTTLTSLMHDQNVNGVADLAMWVQALVRAALYLPLWIVTRAAEPVVTSDSDQHWGPLNPAQAPLWGFGKTLFLEHPELRGGLIDLEDATSVAADADCIQRQIQSGDRDDHVAFRGGQRYAAQLVPCARPSAAPLTLRSDGIHVITGGFGGLGLKCARWLADRGSRHLALLGRRVPPPRVEWSTLPADHAMKDVVQVLQSLEADGVTVEICQVDVAQPDELAACLAVLRGKAPLRGVIHAAGVNWLSKIVQLNRAALVDVLRIKVASGWQLDELTRDCDLDLFVLFSSVASVWGSMELGHYTAANRFLDTLSAWRRQAGLRSLTIPWGPWDEVGMSAKERDRAVLTQFGFRLMPPETALALLEGEWMADRTCSVLCDLDWERFDGFMKFSAAPSLFDRVRVATRSTEPAAASFDLQRVRTAAEDAARAELTRAVIQQLASVMLVNADQEVNTRERFNIMGMDSLMAIAFAARLEQLVGFSIPTTLAYNYPTIDAVVNFLTEQLRGTAVTPAAEPAPAARPPHTVWFAGDVDSASTRPMLLCLPYAGAGAGIYRRWTTALQAADVVAVQLPGRDERSRERPVDSMSVLVGQLADALGQSGGLSRPLVLFGHSLGGLVAFELARALRQRGMALPRRLILSGCGLPVAAQTTRFHELPDAEFLEAISRRYEMPTDSLADPAVRKSLLPALRADVRLLETYQPVPEPPLACPIHVLGGTRDALISRTDLLGWSAETRAQFTLDLFEGGHMFLRSGDQELLVLKSLDADLRLLALDAR